MRSTLALTFILVGCAGTSGYEPERPPADGKGDGSWHHTGLRAEDGTTIALDYQIKFENHSSNKPDLVWYLQPLWFNVAGENVHADSDVRVVFMNRTYLKGQCGVPDRVSETGYQVDLEPEPEGHFSGELVSTGTLLGGATAISWQRPIAHEAPYCSTIYNDGSTVSVVVDGTWLTDPVTHSNNFGVRFDHNYNFYQ
jgi:hypothetical protein